MNRLRLRLPLLLLVCLLLTRASDFVSAVRRNWTNAAVADVYLAAPLWPGPPCGAAPSLAVEAASTGPSAILRSQARALWLAGQCAPALAAWRAAAQTGPARQSLAGFEYGRALYALAPDAPPDEAAQAISRSGAAFYLAAIAERLPLAGQAYAQRDLYDLIFNLDPTLEAAPGQSQAQAAIRTWQLVAGAAPATSALHWQALGEAARLGQGSAEARHDLTRALALANPDERYDALLRLGRVLGARGDAPAALDVYDQAIRWQPRASAEPYVAAGQLLAAQGDEAEALAWYARARTAAPTDPWPEIAAGLTTQGFNQPGAAEDHFRAALQIARAHFGAQFFYGRFLLEHGRPAQALLVLGPLRASQDCGVLAALAQAEQDLGLATRPQPAQRQGETPCQSVSP